MYLRHCFHTTTTTTAVVVLSYTPPYCRYLSVVPAFPKRSLRTQTVTSVREDDYLSLFLFSLNTSNAKLLCYKK